MTILKNIWGSVFENSLIAQILMIIVLLLALVLFYFLIREGFYLFQKLKKNSEVHEIIELKKREKQILNKLENEKEDIDNKIDKLKVKVSPVKVKKVKKVTMKLVKKKVVRKKKPAKKAKK